MTTYTGLLPHMAGAPLGRKSYTERLERMVDVARALAATQDQASLQQTIMVAACDLVEAEAAALVFFDRETETLQLRAATWVAGDTPLALTLMATRSLAGMAFRTEGPVAFAEEDLKQQRHDELSLRPGFKIKSVLGVPLLVKDMCIGVLEVFNKTGDSRFAPDDAEALGVLAEQSAIALENARIFSLLKETSGRLASLDRTQSDFLAVASHELSTPLQHIIAQATLMRDAADQHLATQIDDLLAYAERLERVVEEMVELANVESGHLALKTDAFQLAELVREVEAGADPQAFQKNVALHVTLPSEPVTLRADREKIRLVLAHLVDNAIKFSPRDDEVEIAVESAFEQVRLSVSNNGPVIPPDKTHLIFDRFYQVEDHLTRQHEGIGLGLPIARSIVELHGGRIWAESADGRGTRFTFVLPHEASPQPALSTSAEGRPLAEPDGPDAERFLEYEERIRVLLMDVGRALPEMLPDLSKSDAQRHLARYAMRHPEEAYLLSDYSLVRAGESASAQAVPSAAVPEETERRGLEEEQPIPQSDTLAAGSGSMDNPDQFKVLPPRLPPELDEEDEKAERRRLTVALAALVILSLAACLFSLYAVTTRTGRDLVAQVVATDASTGESNGIPTLTPLAAGSVPEATAAGIASDPTQPPAPTEAPPPTQTSPPTATVPPAEATATALAMAAEVSDAPVLLSIFDLLPESGYVTCAPVNSRAGNQLGQACMSIATGYTDDNGQLFAVEGVPAIVGVWLRLDTHTGTTSELVGIASDPTSQTLPPGEWEMAIPGTELNLAVGDWSARALVVNVETAPFPSSPDTAPVLTGLDVELLVTSTGN